MKITILCIFLCLISVDVISQKVLVLTKPGVVNRLRFYENHTFTFRLKGEHITHTGYISDLNDTAFLLNRLMPVNVKDIRMIVDYKKRSGIRFLRKVLFAGGIMYYGIGTANRIIMKDAPPVFEKKFILTSALLIGSSFLLKPLSFRKYRINKLRHLKVIDLSVV